MVAGAVRVAVSVPMAVPMAVIVMIVVEMIVVVVAAHPGLCLTDASQGQCGRDRVVSSRLAPGALPALESRLNLEWGGAGQPIGRA